MRRLRRLSWFPGLRASVLDFRTDTTLLRATLIIILMGTIGTRTSTTIHMRGIHMHITPHPQTIGTAEIGLTTANIGIIVITVIKRLQNSKIRDLTETSAARHFVRRRESKAVIARR